MKREQKEAKRGKIKNFIDSANREKFIDKFLSKFVEIRLIVWYDGSAGQRKGEKRSFLGRLPKQKSVWNHSGKEADAMEVKGISQATLKRLPIYFTYLKSLSPHGPANISATAIAAALDVYKRQNEFCR